MSQPEVSVVVINWRLKEETARCLESLRKSDYPCNVVLVDNGSGDGSVAYLTKRFPHVKVIDLPDNLGFGAACNKAIAFILEETDSEYILLLNNDATIQADALAKLVNAAEANPEAGILGPKIYSNELPGHIWYAGARRRKVVLAAVDTGRGRRDRGQFDTRLEVDYVFGAAMFIRRCVFEQVGLFDKRFFLYLEDLDYCLRAQQAGFSLLFVPQAHIHHIGSASTNCRRSARRYHHARSTVIFLIKHIPPVYMLPVIGFWALVLIKTIALDLLRGETVPWRAYGSGVANGLRKAFNRHSEKESASPVALTLSDRGMD